MSQSIQKARKKKPQSFEPGGVDWNEMSPFWRELYEEQIPLSLEVQRLLVENLWELYE